MRRNCQIFIENEPYMSLAVQCQDARRDGFEKPFRGGCGTADTDAVVMAEPLRTDALFIADMISPDIQGAAEIAEDFAVRALAAGDENYDIMMQCEVREPFMTSRHLPADGIMHRQKTGAAETLLGQLMFLRHRFAQCTADGRILGRALGGLREDFHGAFKTDFAGGQCFHEHVHIFYHDGIAAYLTKKPQHLGMADLSENHDLTAGGIDTGIGLADAFLEIQHTGQVQSITSRPSSSALEYVEGGSP